MTQPTDLVPERPLPAAPAELPSGDRWPWGAILILAAVFAAIYAPDVGHGFIKDDFIWIAKSRVESLSDMVSLFRAPTGFFRPVVSLSFAANSTVCGLAPRCYGVTNLALTAACAVAIVRLAAALGLGRGAATAAGALWAFNIHGIDMAMLWISGRTSLLLTLLATLAATAFVRERYRLAAIVTIAAMGAKEEAVVLPAVLIGFAVLTRRRETDAASATRQARGAVLQVVALVIYALVRAFSGAFTPSRSPQFYRLSFTIDRLASNVLPYADRSVTVVAAACLLFWLLARPSRSIWDRSRRRTVLFGCLWAAGGFALTIFLPIRSSLYACFPSAGIALAGSAWLDTAWSTAPVARRRRALAVGLALPLVLWQPVYRARHTRLVGEAELSSRMLSTIAAHVAEGQTTFVLEDDRTARPSLDGAFGTLAQDAVALTVGPSVRVEIEPPPTDATYAALEPVHDPDVVLRLHNGALERVR